MSWGTPLPLTTAATLVSHSVHTIEKGGRGFDGTEKVNGGYRQLLVDSTGLILSVMVHEASLVDRDGARRVLKACSRSVRHQRRNL